MKAYLSYHLFRYFSSGSNIEPVTHCVSANYQVCTLWCGSNELPDRIYIKLRVQQVPPYLKIYDVNISIVSSSLFLWFYKLYPALGPPMRNFFFCRFRNLILKSIRARGCNLYFSYKKNLRTRSQ